MVFNLSKSIYFEHWPWSIKIKNVYGSVLNSILQTRGSTISYIPKPYFKLENRGLRLRIGFYSNNY